MKRNHKWVDLMNAISWGNIDHWDKYPDAVFSDNYLACRAWVKYQLDFFTDVIIKQNFTNYFYNDMRLNNSYEYQQKDVGVSIIGALYKKEKSNGSQVGTTE